jgi:predicted protein tyrosine phosphatase
VREDLALSLRFHDVVRDRAGSVPPQRQDISRLLEFGDEIAQLSPGTAHLLIHCAAGISRSTAAMILLVAQAAHGGPANGVLAEVFRLQPNALPNIRMIRLGDGLLKYRGLLVAAVNNHYSVMKDRFPEIAALLHITSQPGDD